MDQRSRGRQSDSATRGHLVADSMGWVGSTPSGGVDADVIQVDLGQIEEEMKTHSGYWRGKVLEATRHGEPKDRATGLEQLDKLLTKAYEVRAIAVIAGQSGSKSEGVKLSSAMLMTGIS